MEHKYYYMHLINGRPASFKEIKKDPCLQQGVQIVYADCSVNSSAKLVRSLRQIRREQVKHFKFLEEIGLWSPKDSEKYDYIKVEIPVKD